MNIDKLIANEFKYSYVNRNGKSLNQIGLTFTDLKGYLKVGSSNHGRKRCCF